MFLCSNNFYARFIDSLQEGHVKGNTNTCKKYYQKIIFNIVRMQSHSGISGIRRDGYGVRTLFRIVHGFL